MGIPLSTPNFNPREDQLLLPNEILYNITQNLGARDILWAQLVCRSWFSFATTSTNHPHWFVGDGFGISCVGSEERLHQLAMAHQRQNFAVSEQENGIIGTSKTFSDDLLPLRIAAFFLENVELTRQPLSHQFWDLYSETITRLEFTDSAVLPRVRVETRGADGNPVNFDTNFNLGCPNLKKLALKKMDKSFMLGGEYLEFHHILCLSNLISLDVSNNKNITDRILFDLLLKTEKLERLNLTGCPLVLSRAVHNRFYPRANTESDESGRVFQFSDHIFSFETIVQKFLSQPKGSLVRELILKATPLTSYTLELIIDPKMFTWEYLDLSYCRELKKDTILSVLRAHSNTLKKLSLKSDGRGVVVMDVLKQVHLPKLEHLSLRNAQFDRDAVAWFGLMPQLKNLSCSSPCRARIVPVRENDLQLNGSVMETHQKAFSTLRMVTHLNLANSNEFVNNGLLQVVIQTMKHLKKLNLSGCDSFSDFGLTGLVSPAQERNWEESGLGSSVLNPSWLLRPITVQKRTDKLELELLDLIENGNFPSTLDPAIFKNRRDWTGCLSDLKYLEVLDLSSCRNLSALTWHFAIRFPSLHTLNLAQTNLSLNSIAVIVKHCPCLELLTLVETNSLVNLRPFLSFIRKSLHRLREIQI